MIYSRISKRACVIITTRFSYFTRKPPGGYFPIIKAIGKCSSIPWSLQKNELDQWGNETEYFKGKKLWNAPDFFFISPHAPKLLLFHPNPFIHQPLWAIIWAISMGRISLFLNYRCCLRNYMLNSSLLKDSKKLKGISEFFLNQKGKCPI